MKNIIDYIKNIVFFKKLPYELDEGERKACMDIDNLTKNTSWDVLNVELYNHLKKARKPSAWRILSGVDKYAKFAFTMTATLFAFALSIAGASLFYVFVGDFILANISMGVSYLDGFFGVMVKTALAIIALLGPVALTLFSFSKIRKATNSSITKRQAIIFNNKDTWGGIDEKIKDGFSQALPLPLPESWWEGGIDILKEYGKIDKNEEKPKENIKDEFVLKLKSTVSKEQSSKV